MNWTKFTIEGFVCVRPSLTGRFSIMDVPYSDSVIAPDYHSAWELAHARLYLHARLNGWKQICPYITMEPKPPFTPRDIAHSIIEAIAPARQFLNSRPFSTPRLSLYKMAFFFEADETVISDAVDYLNDRMGVNAIYAPDGYSLYGIYVDATPQGTDI